MTANEHHLRAINEVLKEFNLHPDDPWILKGGTALMTCYGLDRFSEDIDLDAARASVSPSKFEKVIEAVCRKQGYTYHFAKKTPTVQRAFINYGDEKRPLKIELSKRRQVVNETAYTHIRGIKVYTLDELAAMKTAAYLSRDKIRDLYDLTFIINEYFAQLSKPTKDVMSRAFEYKDTEQFDYLVATQQDPLIDTKKLETMYLQALQRLGIQGFEESLPAERTSR